MKNNIFTTADSYKYGHSGLLPKNTVSQYNYMIARDSDSDEIVFTGMQYYLKAFLSQVPTKEQMIRAERIASAHGVAFDKEMWEHIIELGYYPIHITSIPEGTTVPIGMVLATFQSTDPKAVGLVGFLETLFMKVWYPTAVATQSKEIKDMLCKYGSPEWAQFAYHNFGNRSATSEEAAMIAGFAHLTHFSGSDSIGSLFFAEDYYDQPKDQPAGFSVLASEHSVTTMNGRDGEEQFVYDTLMANPDLPIISFVADSYDVYAFTEMITDPDGRIRKLLESRKSQKLVIRPDSGDPIVVIHKILKIMAKNYCFDSEINHNGVMKALSTRFGILWGDGITSATIEYILKRFTTFEYIPKEADLSEVKCFAAENFVFGSGTDLVNSKNRDTHGFAVKCSSITIEHIYGEDDLQTLEPIDVFKDPITDTGKASHSGRVTTRFDTKTNEWSIAMVHDPISSSEICMLQDVFRNGRFLNTTTLDEIRAR
jgi:nicotinamide phosphoribosyltransferase